MAFTKTFIPYGGYWASPFCRWQGSIAHISSLKLAAATTERFLESKDISPETFDGVSLGFTVPQKQSFYGAPWFAALIGAPEISGSMYAQACATSARIVAASAAEVDTGMNDCVLAVAFDRCSNGPHVVYPNPTAPGGTADAENWVMDNFNKDPYAKNAMVQTAENVAQAAGISREEQEAVTLMRNEQYAMGLAEDRAFQKRYMFALEAKTGRKVKVVDADEGIFPTTPEGLAKLRPVIEGGSVTFGCQTYPADGNAGIILTTEERAKALSKDAGVSIQVICTGQSRVEKGFMPKAVVPAAQQAISRAGLTFDDLAVIKTHNPFAVNDCFFAKETGVDIEKMNNYGSPLVYGHPQGPTGMRATVELIEELVMLGGGYGLFAGCAAGDSAMAVVLKVTCS